MNEPKKAEPTTQVVHEQAIATNISCPQPSVEPVVIINSFSSHLLLQLTVPQAEIISAAQRGDLKIIRELVESGECKVTDRDDHNV